MIKDNKIKENSDLGKDDIYKLLIKMSIPAIFSMVVAAAYNMVDRIFVGNVNPLGLSAIGVTMPFQILQMAFVMLIGIGASTLISIKYGEQDLYGAKMLLSVAFKMIIVTELIVSIICILFLDNIFKLLNISDELYNFAKDYIIILLIAGVPSLTGYCLNNCVRALGFSKESMIIVIVSSVMNIVLDFLFIMIFKMGVKGAAIATVISQTFVTICVLYFFLAKSSYSPIKIQFRLKEIKNLGFNLNCNEIKENISIKDTSYMPYIKSIVTNGLPTFYMQMFGTYVNIILNSSIIKYGNDYHLATITIISSISLLFTMIIYGIGEGMQPIVGYNFGSKQIDRSIKAVKISIVYVFLVAGIGLALIEIFPDFFTSFFTKDKQLVNLASHNLRIYLIGLPMMGIHSITTTFLLSVKKPKVSTILYILRYGGILLPCLIIIPKHLGIDGVYISKALSDVISGICAGLLLYITAKEVQKSYT